MNSAARKRSSRSVISSAPKIGGASGSSARTSASSASSPRSFSALTGTMAANGKQRGQLRHLRQQRVLVLQAVDLVERDDDARARRQQADHRAIGSGGAAGLDHQHRRVDVGEALGHRAVHPLVEPRAVPRLKAGRVDEDDLGVRRRQDPGDAVARRLRLLRGDADLLADQAIEQRRLADVRPADDRHVAAAEPAARRARQPPRDAAGRGNRRGERLRRGVLLGGAAVRAGARGDDGQRRHAALDGERLRVRLAADPVTA